jgi:riboflavin biosynthesis pyrimidine reductase
MERGDEDVTQCATEYVTRQRIRVAQEKGELVARGNSLDDEIRRAEREIRAMEHTLALVKAANDRYRCSLALPGAATVAQVGDPELHAQLENEERRQQELRNELRRIRDTETRMRETSSVSIPNV